MGNKSCTFFKSDECLICNEMKRDTLMLPCGHLSKDKFLLSFLFIKNFSYVSKLS